MRWILLLLIFCTKLTQAQDCSGISTGLFEVKGNFGTLIIEKKDNWQLERSVEYGIVYLNKVEKINECEFKVRRYRIIDLGILPESPPETISHTKILKVKGDTYYFESTLVGTDMTMENKFVKKSNQISEKFEEIIKSVE